MAAKFALSKGKDNKFYFTLKAGNGENILQSQGYADRDGCENGIASVRKNSGDTNRFELKTSSDGKHYFVLTSTNGQTIGKSQMYKSESGCSNGIASVRQNAPNAALTDAD